MWNLIIRGQKQDNLTSFSKYRANFTIFDTIKEKYDMFIKKGGAENEQSESSK